MNRVKTEPVIWKNCLRPEMAETVEICKKLTALESEWQKLFSAENGIIAQNTAPGRCTVEKDGVTVTIHAKNKSDIKGLKFKQTLFCTVLEEFLAVKVKKINFEAGKVSFVSNAKEARRAFERYAKVVVTHEQIEQQKHIFTPFIKDEKLAETVAATKAIAEKKAKRQK